MDEELIQDFIEDAKELIAELEETLLILENSRNNKELISKVFRAMHSLKGASAMFGFNIIGELTHSLEDIYDMVRNDKQDLSDELFELTLRAVDHINQLLKDSKLADKKNKENHEQLKIGIKNFLLKKEESYSNTIDIDDENRNQKKIKTYYINFEPEKELIEDGFKSFGLLKDIEKLGESLLITNINDPSQKNTGPAYLSSSFKLILATNQDINTITEQFLFVENRSIINIKLLSEYDLIHIERFVEIIRDTIIKYGKVDIDKILPFIPEIEALKHEPIQPRTIKKNLEKGNYESEKSISSIRVSSDKIDEMMNLVSELVTSQAELSLLSKSIENSKLTELAENIEKLSRRFRDNVFHISLVPLERSLTRFQRLVRDVSGKLGKKIILETEGTETELDKTIIEHIVDPIMHILRNSIDHGIEDSETRIKSGKPEQSKILLKAFYSGPNVIIKIKDDGKGIDPEKIRNKAIEKDLIDADANLSKSEILEFLFLPGFSTTNNISDVSGRGVGMDVVKRKIAEINGEVEIESEVNNGTQVTIKLPLTLSIIDGLLVKIGNTNFIFPLNSIVKIFEYKHDEIINFTNNTIVTKNIDFSFINLRNLLKLKDEAPELERIILIEYKNTKVGLLVDEIIGKYQTVLKPMGAFYKNLDIISGASILGDGKVALVFDPYKIISHVKKSNIYNKLNINKKEITV